MGLERADRPTDELSLPVLPSPWSLVLALFRLARCPHDLCFSRRYMKHKRDDEPEKQEDEAVDVTPVMTCVFVVMCCSMLVLLYYFYDHLGASPRAVAPLEKSSGRQGGRGLPGGFVPSLYWVKVTLPKCKSARGPFGGLRGPRSPPFPSLPPCSAVYVIIGIFCLASSTGLYSCLSPLVQRLPFGKCR